MKRLLITGGSGRLGRELLAVFPHALAPDSKTLDISRFENVQAFLQQHPVDLVVHCAAYTNVGQAEHERQRCWEVNVTGTRNIAQVCAEFGIKMLHISTDYVFEGEKGGYREEDPVGPPINYYALTKLVAEESVLASRADALIVRTSFRPREWPYPTAFVDLHTGQDYVDVIAPEIALIIQCITHVPHQLLHVVTERKSVFDLARQRKPDVQAGYRSQATVRLPKDISLNIDRWKQLRPVLCDLMMAGEKS